jgi:hypothetical protein
MMASAKKHTNSRRDDEKTPFEDFWVLESEFSENFPGTEYDITTDKKSGEDKWLIAYFGYNQVQKIVAKLWFLNVILQVNFFSNTSDETYTSFGEDLKKKKISHFEKTTFTDKNDQTHRAYEIKTDLKNWISVYKIVFQLIKSLASPKPNHFTERVQIPVPREEEASAFDFKEVFGNAPTLSKPTETKSITTPTPVLSSSFASIIASVQDSASVVQAPALSNDEVDDITNLVQNLNVYEAIVTVSEVQNTFREFQYPKTYFESLQIMSANMEQELQYHQDILAKANKEIERVKKEKAIIDGSIKAFQN